MCLLQLVLNGWRVEAVLICRGMLFQTMAPEYWKLFLKSSFLCVGIHIFWFVEDRNPYDAANWKLNIWDKYSGHISWTVLYRRTPLLNSALKIFIYVFNCFTCTYFAHSFVILQYKSTKISKAYFVANLLKK